MKPDNTIKQDQIVEMALKRFSHFGIDKTTLTEVAVDMGVSKQALSYYFQDKQVLVNAVIDRLAREYSDYLEAEIQQSDTVEVALLKLTEVKSVFFEKYFMLLSHARFRKIEKDQAYEHWKKFVGERESEMLTNLFETGVQSGELKPLNAHKTAELLLETLYAFSRCVQDHGTPPEPGAFRHVLVKQREVIKLFYQGLKTEA